MPSRCKYCGKFISNTANFCSCCGAPINQQNAETNYNSDYQRIIICPHCHSQLKNSDELLKYETIQCLNCKNTFENPYYDHKNISKGLTSSQKRNLACFFIAIIFFILYLIVTLFETKKNSTPQLSKEWQEAAYNQNFIAEDANDLDYNISFLNDIEKKTKKELLPLFKYYEDKVLPNQIILTEEPLRTLLLSSYGKEKYNYMLTFQKSDKWVERVYETDIDYKYYYDCYKDVPNGDYFAMSYIVDGNDKAFFMELKINNVMYNLNISSYQ